MIERQEKDGDREASVWLLRPNRSFSRRQMLGFLILVSSISVSVAVISWLYGNAFAPLFAMLELSVLGACFVLIARSGQSVEVVELAGGQVLVSRLPGVGRVFAEALGWVSIQRCAGGRIRLSARGRVVEVGAFLGEDERAILGSELQEALAAARRRKE